MIKFLINPFERIAGYKSLAIGLSSVILIALLSTFRDFVTDGLIGFHFYRGLGFTDNLMAGLINVLTAALFLYATGSIISRSKIRFVDVVGTVSMSRIPYLLIALFVYLLPIEKIFLFTEQLLIKPQFDIFSSLELVSIIVFTVLGLVVIVWSVALMYSAYIVSCNPDGRKAVISFIIAIILAEIVSYILFVSFIFNPLKMII